MATPTLTAPKTVRLLDTLRSHLLTTGLPEPASVSLTAPWSDSPGISIQPSAPLRATPAEELAALLLWTHRLHGLTGTWFRVDRPDGEGVHIQLAGRFANGIPVCVYSGLPHAAIAEFVYLAAGEADPVSVDELAWLHTELTTRAAAAA